MSFKSLYLPIDRKSMVLEGDRRGEFVGRASVFNVVDLHGDVVMPGAFANSIRETGGRTKLLYQHDTRRPIGIGEIVETSDALIVKGRLSLATRDALEAYALMLDGVLDGLSIGYETVRADKPKGGVRKLHELKLFEVSVVTFPANVLSTIEAIKAGAAGSPDFHEHMGHLAALVSGVKNLTRESEQRRAARMDARIFAVASRVMDRVERLYR